MRIGKTRSNDSVVARARWVRWRAARLTSAGFEPRLAERLAAQNHVDVHALLELVDRGCPPDLAARILAPLDEPVEQC